MSNFDYKKARDELDTIMAWFESENASVDEAIQKYQQADDLLKKLEKYLSDTKAQIEIMVKQKDSTK